MSISARIPPAEEARQRTLDAYEVLDTLPEEEFDEIARLASAICGTPVALISLIDHDRQWFKAAVGLALRETPRNVAFCAHAILQDAVFTVQDAAEDEVFREYPLVTSPPNIRFYAGAPLRAPDGTKLGALCVMDSQPRELTGFQIEALQILGRQVEAQLELRLKLIEEARREAELRATAHRERDRAILERDRFFELSVDPMCIIGTDGWFRRVNTAFERALDYPSQELLARPYIDLVHPDDVAKTAVEAAKLAHGGLLSQGFENRCLARGGQYRWIAWTSVVVPDEALVYAIARDVTEKKLLEEQLIHSQKMEAVGRLAGGIAHDFNNLLTVILAFAKFVREELPVENQVRSDIEQVLKAAESAASLTRQLMLFSRKGVTEQPRRLDVGVLVKNIDKMLHRIIGEDIELGTRTVDSLWSICADPGQIEQVIVNLIVNARDAMARGGKLLVECANVVLDSTYASVHSEVSPGEYVMLAVTDTGGGMDQATQARIFEPFFTTKEVGRGTGLGLSTVFAIVKNVGGHIWVYSEVGQGTTFKIYLPRERDAARPTEPPQLRPGAATGHETILLVEDEPMVREFARRALARLGYRILEASSGGEAIDAFDMAPNEIDLLITDITMPGIRGHDLAAKLRERRPDLKTLLMSGYTENTLVEQAILDGHHFVEKPLSVSNLVQLVREILDGTGERLAER